MKMSERKTICPGIHLDGSSIRIDLSVYFSNPDAIPATVFAESVAGFNRMAKQASDAIVSILGVDNTAGSALYLETVRNGSKLTDFVFRIFLGSDEEAARTADILHQRFGVNRFMESRHVQNIIFAAIIAFCLRDVVRTFAPAEKAGAAIEATNSVILNAGRDLNIAPDMLEQMFREKIPSPIKAGKGAVQALQPALMKDDTKVKIGGRDGVEIPPAVVTNMPPPSAISDKDKPERIDMKNVRIRVLASDIDRRKSGWAIMLPEDSVYPGKRIKAVLDETIRPSDLMYKAWVDADISIYMSPDRKAQKAFVHSIRTAEPTPQGTL